MFCYLKNSHAGAGEMSQLIRNFAGTHMVEERTASWKLSSNLCLGVVAMHPSPQCTMNAWINKWILNACEKTKKKTRVLWPQMLENHEIVLGMCFCVPLRCSRYKGIYSSPLDFVTCVYAFMENHVFTIPCLSTSSGLPLWLCLLLTWLLTLRI